jgi:hypothetical protein
VKPEAPQKQDYSLKVKNLITDNNLRPLGNYNRLALFGNIDDYNVRLLLFSDNKLTERYYQLIQSYSKYNPPPEFIEMTMVYMPKIIFAEKFGIILPNENNDSEGLYRTWLRNCFLTCNESLRQQVATDHKYGELHRYVDCVVDWTILVPEKFKGSVEGFPDIWNDDPDCSFPPLKIAGNADSVLPPEKPEPAGNWLGVVFNISRFEEAFYGKASIKILQQVSGKENLAGTVIHGGDLLPDASEWCLAIHTASDEQFESIKNAVTESDEPHFSSKEKRIMKIQHPSSLSLPYQGFFSAQGDFI